MNIGQVILLVLVGIFTACNQNAQPVISSNSSLGLVEVTFAGNQTKALNSRASRALSTQSGVLLGALQSRGNFDHNGFRYLWASFSVNNTSTSSLRNVTFVAVATPSTLNGTAVSRLTKFDGSAANPLLALSLKPTQAVHLERGNLRTTTDNASLQVFGANDIAALQTSLATGETALPYGFVASNPNGGRDLANIGLSDGVVTFAVKIPLQTPISDNPYSISLMFEAVTDSTDAITEGLEEQDFANAPVVSERLAQLPNAVFRVLAGSPRASSGVTKICSVQTNTTSSAFLVNSCLVKLSLSSSLNSTSRTLGYAGGAYSGNLIIDASGGYTGTLQLRLAGASGSSIIPNSVIVAAGSTLLIVPFTLNIIEGGSVGPFPGFQVSIVASDSDFLETTALPFDAPSAILVMPLPAKLEPIAGDAGTVYAHYGYVNFSFQTSIPFGDSNRISPGIAYQGQPTVFNVGVYCNAFKAIFNIIDFDNNSWILGGFTATQYRPSSNPVFATNPYCPN